MSLELPPHGGLAQLHLPSTDLAASARFYREVLGWQVDQEGGGFGAPGGLSGRFRTDLQAGSGPQVWLGVDDLYLTLSRAVEAGAVVRGGPRPEGAGRRVAELEDPSGNRIVLVTGARTAVPQTLLTVRDVEASSRWYQRILGLTSDHGGPDYERLLADGELVLQLHSISVEHHHGAIADPETALGNGVLVWFGEVANFDAVVERAQEMAAPVVRAPHRNPPEGQGNGPGHRELWVSDPDGYTVVIAGPDGESWE